MDEETKNIIQTQRRKTLGCVLAVLSFTSAFLWSDLSRGSGFHGGGFHGGGFHGGFSTFHGGGFHPGFPRFHGGEFHPAFREFHGGGFHDGHFGEFHRFSEFHRFHHHGFRRGFVVAPAFGGWWWGGGWGWPYYYYPDGAYYGYGPYAGYWYYCPDPPGCYPYVTQCSTGWQTVPAS